MNPAPYTEDTLVQQTTAEFLEEQLGWQSIYAYNHEVFVPNPHPQPLSQGARGVAAASPLPPGEDIGEGADLADGKICLGRGSDREVVLTRSLREALVRLNPGLPDAAYDDAVRQIVTTVASQSITATNREKYALVRDGVQVTFRNDKGERVRDRLRVFDFDEPANNHFLCVRELWVRGDLYRRRADIVGFVNGLPLLFVECKNIHKDLKTAFEKNYSDYRDTIPHLFHHNAIVMFGNGEKAKIGSITSRWEHFHSWKRLAEEAPGAVDMETLLKGICDKRNFMDLLENFIFFDESSGESIKILARNHQLLGVNRAVDAVRRRISARTLTQPLPGGEEKDGQPPDSEATGQDRLVQNSLPSPSGRGAGGEGKTQDDLRRLGVFWHTQGSGKSYSMVMFTRKVHRKLGGNFTFVVLTDRDDLDTQIYKTFAGCGVVDHDRDPCRASSGAHLSRLLAEHKSFVFSLIQKFNQDVDPDEGYTQRDDIIVITDEAHRTQYGTLALNMRNAIPNASFIGFTGTPLFKDDEITRRVFGEYVSTYDFQRAVEDNATVPLYYDARGDDLGVAIGDLNERIADTLEELEIDDIDVEQRLERELKRDYHIITAGKRLDQVARDLVQHYSTAWETGKAMLVCIDKVTCVRMHRLIEFYWDERIRELEGALGSVTDEQEEVYCRRQIDWMRETRTVVVISEEQGEVDKFRKWDLDITPHRRLIKEGIDLPEKMRGMPQFRNMQRMELDEAFKEAQHPFRIAIVCAMWLTGFDVPSLSTLYLDKPLKAHTLMQAIARANRVHEGKNNGLIVDYCGILKHLRKALATFAGTQPDGGGGETDPARPDEELLADLAETIAFVRTFLEEKGAPLVDVIEKTGFALNAAIVACKEAANQNDETRKRFEVMCREVFKKFKACINVKGINAYRADRDAINIVYKKLQEDREKADITDIIRKIHEVVDEAIEVREPPAPKDRAAYDISRIDFDRLKSEFERSPRKNTTVQNLRQTVERRLQRLLQQNPLRTDFQKHFEEIVADYNQEKDRVTIEQTFEALLKLVEELDQEENRAVREGLDEESLAIFDLLKKQSLGASEIKRIKKVAAGLLEALKKEKLRVDQWREKEATRDAVRVTIRNFLWSDTTGLPVDLYTEDDVAQMSADVFRHVFRAYPTVPSPFYGSAVA